VMEIRPAHPVSRGQVKLHQIEPRLRGRVIALVDQRRRLGMVDLEQVLSSP
jgi:hypothetical protein